MQIYLCFPVCCKTVRIRNDHSQKVHSLLLEQAGWVLRDRKVRRQCQPISFFPSISITQKKFFCLTQQFKLLKYVGAICIWSCWPNKLSHFVLKTFCIRIQLLPKYQNTGRFSFYWSLLIFDPLFNFLWDPGDIFSVRKNSISGSQKPFWSPPPQKPLIAPPLPPSKAVMHSSIYN